MKTKISFILIIGFVVACVGFAFAKGGGDKLVCENQCFVKHLKMAGGDCNKCLDCHTKVDKDDKSGQAYAPLPLKGRYANMGGPNHSCNDCHDGIKATLLPAFSCLSEPDTSCASCHGEK